MGDTLKVTRNYTLLSSKQDILCDAIIRKQDGHIGRFECKDTDSMKILQMTSVWAGRFPQHTCGGDKDKETVCFMPAPGSLNYNAIMIDEFTYLTLIDLP